MDNKRFKVYLSDGAYAELDVRGLVLTAENGYRVTDTVVLDDTAWQRLQEFVQVRLLLARRGSTPDDGQQQQ